MLSRRQLLRLSVLGGSAALLQACAPAAPPAPTAAPAAAAPKPTDAPKPAATAAPAAAAKPTEPAKPAATTAPVAAAKPAAAGGTLTPLWGATLAHVNPFMAVTNAQFQYFNTVFSALMVPSPDKTKIEPELATVTPAADASSYTFKLDPNAKFHDGRPVTSADVAYSYTMALNKDTKSNRLSRLSLIKGGADYSEGRADSVVGIVPLDDNTIRFDMEFPNALFLLETDFPILPKHVLGSVKPDELEKHPNMFESPLGSGPFKAVRNLTDQYSEIEANPDFYRGRPKLDKMIYRIIRQEDAAQIALERGEVDFTAGPSNFVKTPDTLTRLLGVPTLFPQRMQNPVSNTLGFNLRLDHWKDKRVRQALAYAIDRKRIIDSLIGGNAEIVNGPMRHAFVGFQPKNDYAFNPDRAKAMLAEVGWDPNREVLVSALPADSETERAIRAALQSQLQAVGVKTRWEELESSVWVGKFYNDHTHDMVFIPATNFADPHLFLDFHYTTTSRNGVGYATPALDDLIDRGRRGRTQAERAEIYKTIGDNLNEDQPWIWMWSIADTYIFNRRVNIPFIPVPPTNPRTIAEVPFIPVQALFTWFYRPEEWSESGNERVSRYVLRRLFLLIPMLLGITIIAFTFINIAPGDPVTAMIDPQQGSGGLDMQRLREQMGLNQPLPVRYGIWLKEVLTGNFGYSYRTGQAVVKRIGERLPATIELMGAALVFSTVAGCALGIGSALRRYSALDYGLTALTLVWVSVPAFFFALVALYIFALRLGILPTFGMVTPGSTDPFDHLKHLIFPASVLCLEALAGVTRYTRTAMLDVLNQDYVVTARAKGLPERVVTLRHAFRNALLPVITVVSLRIPILLGGAVVIEYIFQWPGMGTLAITSIEQRDYPVLMGLTLMTASLVLLSNLAADILYAYADPRIRYS